MAVTTLLPASDHPSNQHHHPNRRRNKKSLPPPKPNPPVSSWEHFKSLLSCKTLSSVHIVSPSTNKPPIPSRHVSTTNTRICGSSLCAIRDVVHGNTRVVHRSDNTDSASAASVESVGSSVYKETQPLARNVRNRRQTQDRSLGGGCGGSKGGGMPLRGLTGCVECRAISVEPMSRRYPRPRALCQCSECGEVFTKPESLEHHQATRHAVSELGPEDSGRNIVDIIFKSSWQYQEHPRNHPRPMCHVDRILKIHNSPRTLARFEAHRAAVKSRSSARAAADGNELLRFLPAPISCALGLNGADSLCGSSTCGVCSAIRHGFNPPGHNGVRTTASSGRAHDAFSLLDILSGVSKPNFTMSVQNGVKTTISNVRAHDVFSSSDNMHGASKAVFALPAQNGVKSTVSNSYPNNMSGVSRVNLVSPSRNVVRMSATNGRPQDAFCSSNNVSGVSRAMIVCRVIAGRVKRAGSSGEDEIEEGEVYDSVTSDSNLEEMFVMNPRAILPCFVVIYHTLN
ncbi:hypothetical protein LUZ60_016105 [Juncus effusus]|nr:hypothetical protein LUZ60_016105 [Juncus effusus]